MNLCSLLSKKYNNRLMSFIIKLKRIQSTSTTTNIYYISK